MKNRIYAAPVIGALLAVLFGPMSPARAASSCACDCPPKVAHHASLHRTDMRHAPARIVRKFRNADAEYAQSYYNYHSHSRVTTYVALYAAPWIEAPDDARIRFYRARQAAAYYAPQPGGIVVDPGAFNGGVGNSEGSVGGGGGGYTGGGSSIYNAYDPTADNESRARFGFYNRVGSALSGNTSSGAHN